MPKQFYGLDEVDWSPGPKSTGKFYGAADVDWPPKEEEGDAFDKLTQVAGWLPGKAFQLAGALPNWLGRTGAQLMGLPVSPETTLSQMTESALGPSEEFKRENPILGQIGTGLARLPGGVIEGAAMAPALAAAGPLVGTGVAGAVGLGAANALRHGDIASAVELGAGGLGAHFAPRVFDPLGHGLRGEASKATEAPVVEKGLPPPPPTPEVAPPKPYSSVESQFPSVRGELPDLAALAQEADVQGLPKRPEGDFAFQESGMRKPIYEHDGQQRWELRPTGKTRVLDPEISPVSDWTTLHEVAKIPVDEFGRQSGAGHLKWIPEEALELRARESGTTSGITMNQESGLRSSSLEPTPPPPSIAPEITEMVDVVDNLIEKTFGPEFARRSKETPVEVDNTRPGAYGTTQYASGKPSQILLQLQTMGSKVQDMVARGVISPADRGVVFLKAAFNTLLHEKIHPLEGGKGHAAQDLMRGSPRAIANMAQAERRLKSEGLWEPPSETGFFQYPTPSAMLNWAEGQHRGGGSIWGDLFKLAMIQRDRDPGYNELMRKLEADPQKANDIFDRLRPGLESAPIEGEAQAASGLPKPPQFPPMEQAFGQAQEGVQGQVPQPKEMVAAAQKQLLAGRINPFSWHAPENPFTSEMASGGMTPPPPPQQLGLPGMPQPKPQPPPSGAQGGPASWGEILGLPRAMSTILDLSAAGRQGIVQSLRHPILAAKSLAESIKVAASDAYASKALTDFYNRPTLKRNMDAFGTHVAKGVSIGGPAGQNQAYYGARLIKAWTEAQFQAGRPVLGELGHLAERSERAFNFFLNNLRQDVSDYYADKVLGPMGLMGDKQLTRKFGQWINNSTGYGDVAMGPILQGSQVALNNLFFSPRMILARLAVLNPKTYYDQWKAAVESGVSKGDAAALVAKGPGADLAAFTGGVALAIGLTAAAGKAAGQDTHVEEDPRSGDFMKVRLGNTRVDYLGGFQPYIRFAAQMLTGERKDKYGNVKAVPRGDVGISFLRSRLAPAPGLAVSFLTGRDYRGQETGTHLAENLAKGKEPVTPESMTELGKQVGTQVGGTFAPMAWQDIAGALEEDPAQGLALSIPALLGVGVTTHEASQRVGPELEKEFYRLQVSPPPALSQRVKIGETQLGKAVTRELPTGPHQQLQTESDALVTTTLTNLVQSPMYQQADDRSKKLLLMLTVRDLRAVANMKARALVGPPTFEEMAQ